MRACNGPASTRESANVPPPVHIIVSHPGKPEVPMFARIECAFVLSASIRRMNDCTWRRWSRRASHTAHRHIRHPLDARPDAPSLPSLFGAFMLVKRRFGTDQQASPIAFSRGDSGESRATWVPSTSRLTWRTIAANLWSPNEDFGRIDKR